jgi:hypothetical protein
VPFVRMIRESPKESIARRLIDETRKLIEPLISP